MKFIFLSYFPSIIGLLLLGAVAYVNNPRQRLNQLFSFFTFSVASWLLALYCADSAHSDTVALWSLRVAMLLGSVIGFSFLLLSDSFPSPDKKHLGKRATYALGLMALIFMVLALTKFMSGGIKHTDSGTTLESLTIVYSLQTLSLFLQMAVGIIFVVRRRKTATAVQRAQIRLFVFGMICAIILGSLPGFVFILFSIESNLSAFLTGASFFVFGLCVWTAITRHRMFNVRSLVARSIAYFMASLVVASVYALLVGLMIERLTQAKTVEIILTGASALMAITIFRYLRAGFERLTNKLFYKEAYSSRERLEVLTNELVASVELDTIASRSLHVINATLMPLKAGLLVVDHKQQDVFGDSFGVDDYAIKKLLKNHDDTLYEIEGKQSRDTESVVDDAVLILVIRSASSIEGYLLLGPRASGEVYSRQDMNFLRIAARNIGLAINNARSFREISEFNKTLKHKVRLATRELRSKNDELQRLHQTKDDFISMASHQLRPKITASAGFLDLFRKSDITLDVEQNDLINLTQKGIQQMNEIITDMLDVSRMESQRIALNRKPTNIVSLVQDEVERAAKIAGKRVVLMRQGKQQFPDTINVDTVGIREVVQNLIDNALHYSESTVRVELKKSSERRVQVLVHDKGMGLTKEEQRRIFEKFYRSESAKKVRPNGSGIGLYAARLIVEAHGGEMIVSSRKGQGSTFGFELPI